MSDDIETTTPPIEAHATPLPDQIWAAFRQVVAPLTAYLLGRGIIDEELAALVAALVGIVWPIVAGQLKTRRRAVELTTVAASPLVPDRVARLR